MLNLEPLDKKWRTFGWDAAKINGHDFNALDNFIKSSKKKKGIPHMAIAQTHKGFGVSFMAGNSAYHARPLDSEEFDRAIKELNK